mmetsp:Transcript_141605/g.452844  ORF Transcript_141605/g.452844 Transcript_141605/m.452844 type:complete len:310 (+) Transcript_141605:1545-2474(+)
MLRMWRGASDRSSSNRGVLPESISAARVLWHHDLDNIDWRRNSSHHCFSCRYRCLLCSPEQGARAAVSNREPEEPVGNGAGAGEFPERASAKASERPQVALQELPGRCCGVVRAEEARCTQRQRQVGHAEGEEEAVTGRCCAECCGGRQLQPRPAAPPPPARGWRGSLRERRGPAPPPGGGPHLRRGLLAPPPALEHRCGGGELQERRGQPQRGSAAHSATVRAWTGVRRARSACFSCGCGDSKRSAVVTAVGHEAHQRRVCMGKAQPLAGRGPESHRRRHRHGRGPEPRRSAHHALDQPWGDSRQWAG